MVVLSDLVGAWHYVSTCSGEEHGYRIRDAGERGYVWEEGEASGVIISTEEVGAKRKDGFKWVVELCGIEGQLWLSDQGVGDLLVLVTLFQEKNTPLPVEETAATTDSPLVGTWAYVSHSTGTTHAYTIKPSKGGLVWKESDLEGPITVNTSLSIGYKYKVTLPDASGDLWLKLVDREGRLTVHTLYKETAVAEEVKEVAVKMGQKGVPGHVEGVMEDEQNKILAEQNHGVAVVGDMDMEVGSDVGPEEGPFLPMEKVFVHTGPEELEKMSENHGGWGGPLMAHCCGKTGMVARAVSTSDPLVVFGDGQIWRLNTLALSRGPEMLRRTREKQTAPDKTKDADPLADTLPVSRNPPCDNAEDEAKPVAKPARTVRWRTDTSPEKPKPPKKHRKPLRAGLGTEPWRPKQRSASAERPSGRQMPQQPPARTYSPNSVPRKVSVSPSRVFSRSPSGSPLPPRAPGALSSVISTLRHGDGMVPSYNHIHNNHNRRSVTTTTTAARRAKILSTPQHAAPVQKEAFSVDEPVDVYYDGRWLKAAVKRKRMDGNYDIEYSTGEVSFKVSSEFLRRVGHKPARRLSSSSPTRPLTSHVLEARKSPTRTRPTSRSPSRPRSVSPVSSRMRFAPPAPPAY